MSLSAAPVHPVLFALAAPLPLYASNWQGVATLDLWLAQGLTVLGALALQAIAFALLRDARRAAFAASVGVLLFFAFQPVFGIWPQDSVSGQPRAAGLLFASWALFWVCMMALAGRIRARVVGLTQAVNAAAAAALVVPLATLGPAWFDARRAQGPETGTLERYSTDRPRPDIYYIVLDGYGRSDRLEEYFGYDNSAFTAALAERGFHVAEDAFANYAHTYLSLASALNLDYVQALQTELNAGRIDQGLLKTWIRDARVPHLLRQIGYRVVAFPSSFAATNWQDAEVFIDSAAALGEFHEALLLRTPIPDFVDFATGEGLYDWHRERLRHVLTQLGEVPREHQTPDAPLFVFAHILAPHPPFVFASDGSPVAPARPMVYWDGDEYYASGGSREEYLRGYPEQLRFVNDAILRAVDAIIATSPDPPVIVLQGDHGSGIGLRHDVRARTDVRERFPTLLALRAPSLSDEARRATRTPVNVFRTLLRELFGARLAPLPDRAYNSDWNDAERFDDVTAQLD